MLGRCGQVVLHLVVRVLFAVLQGTWGSMRDGPFCSLCTLLLQVLFFFEFG